MGAGGKLCVSPLSSPWVATLGDGRAEPSTTRDCCGRQTPPAAGPLSGWMVESYAPTVNRIDLVTGEVQEVTRLDGTVPDGIAITDDGGGVVSCYRPDQNAPRAQDGKGEEGDADPTGARKHGNGKGDGTWADGEGRDQGRQTPWGRHESAGPGCGDRPAGRTRCRRWRHLRSPSSRPCPPARHRVGCT